MRNRSGENVFVFWRKKKISIITKLRKQSWNFKEWIFKWNIDSPIKCEKELKTSLVSFVTKLFNRLNTSC